MKLSVQIETWPMRETFRISGIAFTHAELFVVRIEDGPYRGRGEACGVYYRGDAPSAMVGQVEAIRSEIEAGLDRTRLLRLLPAGGARHAVDAALWELEAARTATPVWALAGLEAAPPLATVFTIGIGTPDEMAAKASAMTHARAIKLKLAGNAEDAPRLRAVRRARPDADISIDANRGFSPDGLLALYPALYETGVSLIEQPFAIGAEEALEGMPRDIAFAADESVQDIRDLAGTVGRFDIVNIKLDKCGGLTHALEMEREARRLGLKVMVGNMTGTSWSQAPAFVLGQLCDHADLDGPTFLAADRDPAVRYRDGMIECPDAVWGLGG
ncbi:dipeptide epimerase [Flavisphingomonas formosensis]|uniref:dipeptide epimerase n=1 Tax=Flavisphingomonas formosensis TaxID=861534 RepID=UPI001E490C7D|nr:dipeptide epimerase [Sphingomonas formosensis]